MGPGGTGQDQMDQGQQGEQGDQAGPGGTRRTRRDQADQAGPGGTAWDQKDQGPLRPPRCSSERGPGPVGHGAGASGDHSWRVTGEQRPPHNHMMRTEVRIEPDSPTPLP